MSISSSAVVEGRGYGCEAAFDGFIKVCLCAKAVHSRRSYSGKHKVSFFKYYILEMAMPNFDLKKNFLKKNQMNYNSKKEDNF